MSSNENKDFSEVRRYNENVTEIRRYNSPEALWGVAVSYTKILSDGTMWIGNDEYETQVNFCPMTGEEAKTKTDWSIIKK
jgi:hypothetical protein